MILPITNPNNLLRRFPKNPLKNNSSVNPVLKKENIIAGINALIPFPLNL